MPSQPGGGQTASAGVAAGMGDEEQDDRTKNAMAANRHRRLESKLASASNFKIKPPNKLKSASPSDARPGYTAHPVGLSLSEAKRMAS